MKSIPSWLGRLSFAFFIQFLFLVPDSRAVFLNPAAPWYGKNAEILNQMLRENESWDSSKVAVFDLDGTILRGDLGDTLLFYMLKNEKIRNPIDWRRTSAHLSEAAIGALDGSCKTSLKLLPSSKEEFTACTDLIASIYSSGVLLDGQLAWNKNPNPETFDPAYAWAVSLTAGNRPTEVKKWARQAVLEAFRNPIGTKQKIGSGNYDHWLRVYPQSRDLILGLRKAGFSVWICSATLQYAVEVIAELFTLPSNKVIGVRPQLEPESGKITPDFEGCGSHKDGNQSVITFKEGKKCWLNKVAFQVKSPFLQPRLKLPLTFGMGDSDGDLAFLKEATELRVVLNRQKTQVMCNAYENRDGKWLINPMFFLPGEKKKDPYPCGPWNIKDYEDEVFSEGLQKEDMTLKLLEAETKRDLQQLEWTIKKY